MRKCKETGSHTKVQAPTFWTVCWNLKIKNRTNWNTREIRSETHTLPCTKIKQKSGKKIKAKSKLRRGMRMRKEGERRRRRRGRERDEEAKPAVLPNGNPFVKRPILRGSCECARCTRQASIFLGGKNTVRHFPFSRYWPLFLFLDHKWTVTPKWQLAKPTTHCIHSFPQLRLSISFTFNCNGIWFSFNYSPTLELLAVPLISIFQQIDYSMP